MDILVVIDMQNDFIDGALGTPEAEAIVPNVVDRVKNFNGLVLATRDTHSGDLSLIHIYGCCWQLCRQQYLWEGFSVDFSAVLEQCRICYGLDHTDCGHYFREKET